MDAKKNILMKNNILVKARYHLTSIQSNVLIVILYELQKDAKRGMSCTINRKDFINIISSNDKKTVNGIKQLLNELMQEVIYFKEIKENGKNAIWGKYNLISGYEYDDETDEFTVACSERVYDLLVSYLEIGYTPINVENYLVLKNSYSKRMYDLLRLWSGTKNKINYTISELKELLMLENKYNKYSDFKRKVIDSSVNELNKTNIFEIEYKENKNGRKVTNIDFFVKDLEDRTYFIEDNGDNKNNIPKNPHNQSGEFFIPDATLFTKGTLILFKRDFKDFDFKEDYIEDAFYKSAAVIFEKDDVEKIYANGYEYFKQTLLEKIDSNMMKDIKSKF